MPKRYRLEVWNRTNTQRQAVYRDVLSLERTRVLQGEESLKAAVAFEDAAHAQLGQGAVLRVQEVGEPSEYSLWRLVGPADTRNERGELRSVVSADALWTDLRHGMVRQRQADGRVLTEFGLRGLTPTQWIEDVILPGYDGTAATFERGVVEATDTVDLNFQRTTPLEAVRMLEAATGYEVQFRRTIDGSGYLVDLLARVGSTTGAELRYRKNLRGLTRTRDEGDVVTRLYAWGADGLSLADARWVVAGVGGAAGARELFVDGLVVEDGAFVGLFFYVAGKGGYPITGSDVVDGTITVDDTSLPALAADDVGQLSEAATGGGIPFVESPTAVASYGVRVGGEDFPDVPNVSNLVANADLAAWSAGLPTSFTKLGSPTVAQDADPLYTRHGGANAHVTASAADEGVLSPSFTIPTGDAARPYLAIAAGLTVIAGKVRLELRHSNGKTYPIRETPGSEGLDVYMTLSAVPVQDEPLPAGTAQLAVVAHGAAAEWHLDTMLASPIQGEQLGDFFAGDGALRLWEEATAKLVELSSARLEYAVAVVDLHRADPGAFPFDALDLGDDVAVRDPDFGASTQRVVEIAEDLLEPGATRVSLAASASRRLNDMWRPVVPRYTGQPVLPRPVASKPRMLAVSPSFDAAADELTLAALANETTASLQLRTKAAAGDAWGAVVETISDRFGTFAPLGVEEAADLFWQITPLDGQGAPGEPVDGYVSNPESGAHQIRDLRFTRSGSNVVATWNIGSGVTETYPWLRTLAADSEDAQFPSDSDVRGLLTPIDAADPQTLTIPLPATGYLSYLQLEPRYLLADGTLASGPIWRRVISPDGAVRPAIDTDWLEGGTTATAWLAVTGASSVEFRSAIGSAAPSAWGAPTRESGDASTVKGGTLGEGEYEFDITLDGQRNSSIDAQVGYGDGLYERVTYPSFDKNREPNVIAPPTFDPNARTLSVPCDSDTRSIQLVRTDGGGTYELEADGTSVIFDLSQADASANPGMATSDRWTVDVIARSDPTADVDVDTLTSAYPMTLTGSTWSAGSHPQFDAYTAGVDLDEPDVGDVDVTIRLKATGPTTGYELHLYEQHQTGGRSYSDAVEITADTTPAATGQPPTASTDYVWTTDSLPRKAKQAGVAQVAYYQRIIAEIEETATGTVRDSREIVRSWLIS